METCALNIGQILKAVKIPISFPYYNKSLLPHYRLKNCYGRPSKKIYRAHCNFFVKMVDFLLKNRLKNPHHPGGFWDKIPHSLRGETINPPPLKGVGGWGPHGGPISLRDGAQTLMALVKSTHKALNSNSHFGFFALVSDAKSWSWKIKVTYV